MGPVLLNCFPSVAGLGEQYGVRLVGQKTGN